MTLIASQINLDIGILRGIGTTKSAFILYLCLDGSCGVGKKFGAESVSGLGYISGSEGGSHSLSIPILLKYEVRIEGAREGLAVCLASCPLSFFFP